MIYDDLILFIKQKRKEQKLTQKDIANLLMIDRSTFGRYETYEREMPFTHVVKTLYILGYNLDIAKKGVNK